jgi:hypothetical protein
MNRFFADCSASGGKRVRVAMGLVEYACGYAPVDLILLFGQLDASHEGQGADDGEHDEGD